MSGRAQRENWSDAPPMRRAALKRKAQKIRDHARSYANQLGGVDRIFQDFQNRPSERQFEEMCVEASLGGSGDVLFAGGTEFAFEYLFGEIRECAAGLRSHGMPTSGLSAGHTLALDRAHGVVQAISTQSEPWGNLACLVEVDMAIAPFLTTMAADDFAAIEAERGRLLVDRETGALGLSIACEPFMKLADLEHRYPMQAGRFWTPSRLKAEDRVTLYWAEIGPVGRFLERDERLSHGVQEHRRRLGDGRIIPVRAHDRRNPRRMGARVNEDAVRHVVYQAYDAGGVVRYIGEGGEDRPRHVNSGISHNYKLNEHFFLRGEMRVEILARHLDKSEARAIEAILLRTHTGPELWNVRDYEYRGQHRPLSG